MAVINGSLLFEIKGNDPNRNSCEAYSDGLKLVVDGEKHTISLNQINGVYRRENVIRQLYCKTICIAYNKDKMVMLHDNVFVGVTEAFNKIMQNEWKNVYKHNSDTIKWINACTTIFALESHFDYNLFGHIEKSFLIRFGRRVMLKKSWNVKNRKDTINTLNGLLDSRAIDELNNADNNDVVYKNRMKALCAWDLQRVMLVGGFAYLAGYLTFEEALDFSLDACKKIQNIFSDWEDYNNNYLVGHMLWSGVNVTSVDQVQSDRKLVYEDIMKDEITPWDIPWNTNLTREW